MLLLGQVAELQIGRSRTSSQVFLLRDTYIRIYTLCGAESTPCVVRLGQISRSPNSVNDERIASYLKHRELIEEGASIRKIASSRQSLALVTGLRQLPYVAA